MDKVLFWDFQGTLAHNDWMFSKALYKVLMNNEPNSNISIEEFKKRRLIGFPWQNPEKEYLHLINNNGWWKHAENIFSNFYKEIGINEEKSVHFAQQVRSALIKSNEFILYDDTIGILDYYKQQGFDNIILSNHIPELEDIVSALGISKYITLCISSGKVGYEKPNPKIYKYALEKAHNPSEIWMIGDSIDADVKGAESVGIKGILVRSEKDSTVKRYSKNLIGLKEIII